MLSDVNIKINLGLHVTGKREDGYHNLETLFYPCSDITDTLEIIEADDYSRTIASLTARYGTLAQAITPDGRLMVTIAREGGIDWDPLEDLTAKAYYLLGEDFDLPSMKIFLEKRAPVGAGLGGGSADGAFALRMISSLAGLNLNDKTLAAYASRLGSDCAFFIYNRPMFGSGRGDVLEDFPLSLNGYRIKLYIPEGVSVSTGEAYRGITTKKPAIPLKEVLSRGPSAWKGVLVNDFEESVLRAHPELSGIKEKLYEEGAVYASMSGSGSAFFSIVMDL